MDKLIDSLNADVGNCTANILCTRVICVIPAPQVIFNVEVSFSPCEVPISVRHRVATTPIFIEFDTIIFDAISTESQVIPFQPPLPFSVDVTVSQTNVGVIYGVSFRLCVNSLLGRRSHLLIMSWEMLNFV